MATNLPDLLGNSKAKLPAIIGALVPVPVRPTERPVDLPAVVTITPEIVKSVESLSLHQVPATQALTVSERRMLTPEEIDALSREREELDAIEAYIKARKEAHRSMLFNHFDVTAEEADGGVPDEIDMDDKGHYIKADEVARPDGAKRFVRQLTKGAVSLTAERLEAQIGQNGFTRDDYLACTTAVRVLDEPKALLALRRKPEMATAWSEALEVGKGRGALYHR